MSVDYNEMEYRNDEPHSLLKQMLSPDAGILPNDTLSDDLSDIPFDHLFDAKNGDVQTNHMIQLQNHESIEGNRILNLHLNPMKSTETLNHYFCIFCDATFAKNCQNLVAAHYALHTFAQHVHHANENASTREWIKRIINFQQFLMTLNGENLISYICKNGNIIPLKPFIGCPICDKLTKTLPKHDSSFSQFSRHLFWHLRYFRYACRECHSFKTIVYDDIMNHIRVFHNNNEHLIERNRIPFLERFIRTLLMSKLKMQNSHPILSQILNNNNQIPVNVESDDHHDHHEHDTRHVDNHESVANHSQMIRKESDVKTLQMTLYRLPNEIVHNYNTGNIIGASDTIRMMNNRMSLIGKRRYRCVKCQNEFIDMPRFKRHHKESHPKTSIICNAFFKLN